MKYMVGNAQDMGMREQQEDSFSFSNPENESLVRHGGFLGIVADGMGGMAFGREASQIAQKTFLRSYEAKSHQQSIPEALKGALKQANQAVLSVIEEKGMQKGAVGTTLSAAVIHDGNLYWISVGDSRIYLYRREKLFQVTQGHTVGSELDKKAADGDISKEKALNDPEREVLISYLGIDRLPQVDVSEKSYKLEPGDRIIVSSDGLFNALTDEEIAAEISGNLQETCERLVHKALAKNAPHQDNITVIALAAGEEDIPQARVPTGMKKAKPGTPRKPRSTISWIIILVLLILITLAGFWRLKQHTTGGKPQGKPTANVTRKNN
jgi:serine/threonine protein phosphatase PrpC